MKKTTFQQRPPGQTGQRKGFNDNDGRYLCCRGKYHVKKAAIIVGIVELGAVALTIAYCVIAYLFNGFYEKTPKVTDPVASKKSLPILALAMSIIAAIIWIVAVALMIIGIRKSKPGFLYPHMMVQVLAIVSLAGLAALFVWWVVDVNDQTDVDGDSVFGNWDLRIRTSRKNVTIATIVYSALAVATIIAFFVEIIFFFVVRRCYKYLSAKVTYLQKQQRKQSPGSRVR